MTPRRIPRDGAGRYLGVDRVPAGHGNRAPRLAREAIRAGLPLGETDPVLCELTAGSPSARRAEELRALLLRGPMLAVAGLQDWEHAAQLYRTARSRGLTVRSSVDCLIAAVALRTESPVLTTDRDFHALAEVSDLLIERPEL
jgi:predicted nucleic acid-binding protein